ncbi:MAG: hypothetical protein IPJ14_06845 [Kineosporiaceae bacterium]|nr:hypothetical protein [Kineosporiaceae bacterium]
MVRRQPYGREPAGLPEDDAFRRLLLHGLDVLRARNVPMSYLTPNEREWWLQHRATPDAWLPPYLVPAEQDFAVREPGPDEEILLADMGPDKYDNKIYIRRTDTGFEALVRSPDEYPGTRWHTGNTLYRLYLNVGESFTNNPPARLDPSIRPFMAVDTPNLRED